MTLFDRFVEFDRWSVSRKTALLSCIGLLLQVPNSLFFIAMNPHMAWADRPTIEMMAWALVAALTVSLAVSLVAVWRGWEGRWTALVLIVPYGFLIAAIIWGFGAISTSMSMLFPMLILLVTLWYGVQWGWWTLLYGLCLTVGIIYLPLSGHAPYAPFLLDRTLDSQNNLIFVSALGYLELSVFLFCFGLTVLVLKAKRAQQARLDDAYRQLDRSARVIRRYIPSQIADRILAGEQAEEGGYQRRKLTIFFSDLVGFTDISEELEPEDLSHVLNEYFSTMTAIAQKHGGTVDELSGDAILIFFGAPVFTDDKDHALRAARMAVEMQQAMAALNAKWRTAGITEPLQVRMGINSGVVTIGNFGSPDRMKYAALGKHVNLAARLQTHCEPGKVLLSHATWLLINDQIPCTPKGELQLKGLHKPVMSYELGAA